MNSAKMQSAFSYIEDVISQRLIQITQTLATIATRRSAFENNRKLLFEIRRQNMLGALDKALRTGSITRRDQ